MRDFLQREETFPENLKPFSSSLAEAINDRVKKIVNNRILQISTLLDPRFAYNEEIWSKVRWGYVEEELIAFAKESKNIFFYFSTITWINIKIKYTF